MLDLLLLRRANDQPVDWLISNLFIQWNIILRNIIYIVHIIISYFSSIFILDLLLFVIGQNIYLQATLISLNILLIDNIIINGDISCNRAIGRPNISKSRMVSWLSLQCFLLVITIEWLFYNSFVHLCLLKKQSI